MNSVKTKTKIITNESANKTRYHRLDFEAATAATTIGEIINRTSLVWGKVHERSECKTQTLKIVVKHHVVIAISVFLLSVSSLNSKFG